MLSKEKMREYQRNRRKQEKMQKTASQDAPESTNIGQSDVNYPVNQPVCKPKAVNLPDNYGLENCACMHCQQNRRAEHKLIINHGAYKAAADLGPFEVNRQILPGDVDYAGVRV